MSECGYRELYRKANEGYNYLVQISQLDNYVCVWTLFANSNDEDSKNFKTLTY